MLETGEATPVRSASPRTASCKRTGVAWVLAAVLAVPALAQTGAAPAPADASQSSKPIAVADILSRADQDLRLVDDTKRLLAAPDPAVRLARALDDLQVPVDAKLHGTRGDALRTFPVIRLESLERHWQFDGRRVAAWEADSRRARAPYADAASQLATRRAAWAATRAEGLLDALPSALATRVDTTLGELDAIEQGLSTALTRQIVLSQRAVTLQASIQAAHAEVLAAIDEIDQRLLRRDAPPLWEGLPKAPDGHATFDTVVRGLDIESRFAIDYRAAGSNNQMALRAVQLLLLPLLLWLVVRSRRTKGQVPASANVVRALQRPFSTWLLLSMLAVLVLEPDAPMLVQEAALLLALVPVLRLLPAATWHALGAWPHVAVGLYAIDRLGVLAMASAELYRGLVLGLAVLSFAMTVWLMRRAARLAGPANDSAALAALRRGVRPVGSVVLGVFAVSAVANVAGLVSLAGVLNSGVIDSGYFALLLFAGVTALRSVFHAVLGQPEIARLTLVREYASVLYAGLRRLLILCAVAGWLLYTLDLFRLLRPLQGIGTRVLDLGFSVGQVSIELGGVLVFAVSIWLAFWAARGTRALLRDQLPRNASLPRGAGNSIASLSYYALILLGFLLALSAAGFKVSQLAFVFGALSVGIGFGLQGVVSNFVSGLVLMFERPIQPGDVIDAAGTSGSVREIGLRATIIRTGEGADVVVPNSLLLSGNLTNWTLYDRSRRIEVPVGVAYGSDPAQVLAVLTSAAAEVPGVAAQPAPVTVMAGFGDSALNFVVRVWTDDLSDWGTVRSALLIRVLAALDHAGVSIPYPRYDVQVRTVADSPPPSA